MSLLVTQQRNDFVYAPNMVRYARRHRWRDAQRLMDAGEVVEHVVQSDRMLMVLELLGEAVGQPGEPAHSHPHGQVLTVHAFLLFLADPSLLKDECGDMISCEDMTHGG